MKRIVFSITSFLLFIIEFIVQIIYVIGGTFQNIFKGLLFCLIRYHNRIQYWTKKNNIIIIEEVKV